MKPTAKDRKIFSFLLIRWGSGSTRATFIQLKDCSLQTLISAPQFNNLICIPRESRLSSKHTTGLDSQFWHDAHLSLLCTYMEKWTIKSHQHQNTKTLAEKGMSSSKMQHNLLCQTRLQKSLFLAVLSLMISHLHLTTFLMTNAAFPLHATSFLSGVVVKTKKSKIPYLPRKQLNWDSIIMEQSEAEEKSPLR